jgi:hypothetical protein
MAFATATIIGAIGLATSVAGGVVQYAGQQQQQAAQKKMIAASQRQEAIRQQQMSLEADRKRRQAIREGIISRGNALNTAANQGVSGGSSVMEGAFGTIEGQTGRNVKGINQNEAFGGDMFEANMQESAARSKAADGASLASTGSGLSSLGGAIFSNAGKIAAISQNLGARVPSSSGYNDFNFGYNYT